MHILITVNSAWNVWNFRRTVVKCLLHDGHKITILAPYDDSVSNLKELGCNFIPIAMNSKGLNPIGVFKLQRIFKKLFKEEKPDVILSYTIKNNIFGAFAASSLGIPFIPNITGLGTAFLSSKPLELLAKILYCSAFRHLPIVFFQNEEDAKYFLDKNIVSTGQIRVLSGSGIDLDEYTVQQYPKNDGELVFLMVSRLLRDKGVYEFVEAARSLKPRYSNIRFQLLGSIAAQNRTAIDRDTVAKWKMEGIVEYLGSTKDVRKYIARADCVVLPSYREGAPRTLIEASAMGRPVIATNVPGCSAVVSHELSGFLCEVKNAQSLADAFQKIYKMTHSERLAMGLEGRKKMEAEFDVKYVVAMYRDALNDIRVDL